MENFSPEIIYIDDSAYPYPKTWEIVEKLPRVPVHRIGDKTEVLENLEHHGEKLDTGKQVLFLTRQKGRFFKKCPG